ncbi:Sua5/YciO/YrdC/YwlC family protein [Aliiglaciecola litoralis]|uniref:Threonylcarbamoyl-AMP synthase n=1 Tax=Aliiglaciecola litoralis TaxID=582857 RepID=A0ABN1LT73_9ALTE
MIISTFSDELKLAFSQGRVFAYPTEAVFGLGCDPLNESAVLKLLKLKSRPLHKGLILIASCQEQLAPFADFTKLPEERRKEIDESWPGPNTWLVPKKSATPDYLTGGSDLIAVRVSAHPVVRQLCDGLNSALVSTSANVSGAEPARTQSDVLAQFSNTVLCVDGAVGTQNNPSQIRNALTGDVIRAG